LRRRVDALERELDAHQTKPGSKQK
jgi:hypothetical protein